MATLRGFWQRLPTLVVLTVAFLAFTVCSGVSFWMLSDVRKHNLILMSIQNRGGSVERSHGWVMAITLPADATAEEESEVRRLFPRTEIMITPKPDATP
jgi:hypothetical protein